ncbi:SpoIIE family protein phosphatase [Actinacidiphila paucisporea]|uniref:Serine phosphatase RsbU, regulator of sigma subunit n=1 Tax=Actinacidiphila paucisporea TaxID=310782 RepID=A0A1M7NLH5_9ACTN|nr:SpoIIE family protein phosphatase [Actinacidiphila paucisporea]SHN04327.1 Serine phosphatase RsbU, regulator of sigma subunit [Actinacidiphila paucisporea]
MPNRPSKPASGRESLNDAVIDAVFSQSPAGLQLFDPELRLVRVNTAARRIRDFPVDQYLGCGLGEVLRSFDVRDSAAVERAVAGVLESGRPVLDLRIRARTRSDSPIEAVGSLAVFRLRDDASGSVLGVAISVTDITRRVRAEEGLRLLNEAAVRVGTTLDMFRTAAEFCDLAGERLADTVAVDIFDSVIRGQAPTPAAMDGTAELRRAGFRSAHSDQGVPAVGEITLYRSDTPHRDVLATLAPRLFREVRPDAPWLASPSDRRYARIREAGVHSMIIAPLRARGVVLGLASFYRWRDPRAFDREDLALVEQLTGCAALCLDNARLYGRERSVARIVQRDLREPKTAEVAALDLAHSYLPAGAGGGWFDVIPLAGARVALVAGDAVLPADDALAFTSELRAASEALSDLGLTPDEILERLHGLSSRPRPAMSKELGGASDTWAAATCLYIVYDPVTRLCAAASAGHPAPALLHADGGHETLHVPVGPPLGHGMAHYEVTEQELPEGSVLVLHNAALPLDADRTGRLQRMLTSPHTTFQSACDAAVEQMAPEQPDRDVYLLAARTRALSAEQTNAWTLPHTPEAVSRARELASRQLADWGIGELADSAVLVVSELVTNAVRYATGPIHLRLLRDGTLTCEVTDDSSTAPQLRRALETDENGRGLFITARLTQRWGVRRAGRGKTIWAEMADT